MAGFEKRPKVNELRLKVLREGTMDEVRGAVLDDVLRAILFDLVKREGWTQAEAGQRLGITQQNVARILDRERYGTSLDVLSRMCAALRETPIDFFRRHERYRDVDNESAEAQYAEDAVFDGFRRVLTPGTAKRLLEILESIETPSELERLFKAAELAGIGGGSADAGADPK